MLSRALTVYALHTWPITHHSLASCFAASPLSESFFGGASVGLVGWGGAQVIIPGMTHPTMSLSQLSATGISLTSLSLSTVSSGVQFLRDESVAISTAAAIAVPAAASARLGTLLAKRLSGDSLSLIFNGLSIVLIPIHFWVQQRAQNRPQQLPSDNSTHFPAQLPSDNATRFPARLVFDYTITEDSKIIQHAAYGVFSGLLSSLMGVGGLPITMSYLTETTNLPHHLVQGTAVCALVPSIVISAFSRMSAIPLGTTSLVAAGATCGAVVGSKVALSTSEERLRQLYMLSIVLFGGRSSFAASRNIKNIWHKQFS